MSFFNELKRRNVVRVGVAYTVASWLLLQVTDVLKSVLGLPEVAGRLVFLLLVIGFIPALLFAWAFEITPDGIRRDPGDGANRVNSDHAARKLDKAVIVMLFAVATLVVVDRLVPESRETSPEQLAAVSELPDRAEQAVQPSPVAQQGMTSLAVLPFTNMSADADNEYFSDGISEELLNLLVNVEGLRVPSRTSSFAFKGRNTDIREIAGQLGVDHILEGSVRKSGNRVRITAQLIDVTTDTHMWSETYDRELEDIFTIQDEIAARIVAALKLALNINVSEHPPTSSIEAYNLYLQGRFLLRGRGVGLRQAESILLQSLSLDPGFVQAWAALAQVYVNFPNYLGVDRVQAFAEALHAAERALALDPLNVDASLVVAQVESSGGVNAAALAHHSQIVAQHPGHSIARLWYGIKLLEAGYIQAAREQFAAAVDTDPSYGLLLDWYARALLMSGDREQARQMAVRAVQLGRIQARVPLMIYCMEEGGKSACMRDNVGGGSDNLGFVERLFELIDDPSMLPQMLDWAEGLNDETGRRPKVQYLEIKGALYMVAGDAAAFFQQLRVIVEFDDSYATVVWYPSLARLRKSPEMAQWAMETGLVDLWRERGWPDLCRPDKDAVFVCD
jgi:adenylate cyclase